MATKSFLNGTELRSANEVLLPPAFPPQGDESQSPSFGNFEFSDWLALKLEGQLKKSREWSDAAPIGLGSWARGELCPRSDIDLIFCGKEEAIKKVVNGCHDVGLRIRYRVPENLDDWMVGVGPMDWLSFLHGKPFSVEAQRQLESQQVLLRGQGRKTARKILQTLYSERKERHARYDSISNFLEPNLKYGAGGLRDIQQALYILDFFRDDYLDTELIVKRFGYYRDFFLTIRQKLHVLGENDILRAEAQRELSEWLGYSSSLDFMKEVQKGLARCSFYSDWVFEFSRSSKKKKEEVERRKVKTTHDAFTALRDDSSILMQYRVRRDLDAIFSKQKPSFKDIGRWLGRYIHSSVRDDFVRALFRSRLVDKCLPNLRFLVGHVQHNQYHRYTVHTHIQQSLRVLLRLHQKLKKQNPVGELTTKMSLFDWKVLVWTCLYHDIGKGRKGDHSLVGAQIAKKDLTRMQLPQKLIDEVVWMVENHLALSKAAFRKNPKDRNTWDQLHKLGLKEKRIERLALFTIVDIQATNPEAWNEWKEQLLFSLVNTLQKPEAVGYFSLLKAAEKKKKNLNINFIKNLDEVLLENVSTHVLLKDSELLAKTKESLEPLVVGSESEKWVRFHEKEDRPGLFVDFVQRIFATGASIRQASIRTNPEFGVYDWFLIKTNKSSVQLKKLLKHPSSLEQVKGLQKKVRFAEIELVESSIEESILSFRGKDQKGALVVAAQTLFDLGLEIRWAAVHTWGRSLEDVFGVVCKKGVKIEEVVKELKSSFT